MTSIFPEAITNLPKIPVSMEGASANLLQSVAHQLIFVEFSQDAELAAHSHKAEWAFVVAGKIDLTIDGVTRTYQKGDSYLIPDGVVHSAKFYEGFATVAFFDQPDRYSAVESNRENDSD